MPTFIILLRGVNVGKAKRVPMADFKDLLLTLGCRKVTTLLNSGNAVVEAPRTTSQALAKKIAIAIADHFNFEVPVVVKSADELDSIVTSNELASAAADPSRLLVAFGKDNAAIASLQAVAGLVAAPEQFLLKQQAAYLYCARGILESKAAKALLGQAGKAVTTRNWATVLKLHARATQSAA
jgi:uncharacterized protein (DUF1697 family)